MGRCPLLALFAVAAGACWLFLRIPAACRACAARGVLAATVANVVRACRHHVSRTWRLEGFINNLSVLLLDCPKDVDDDLCAALQSVIRRSPPCYAPTKKNTEKHRTEQLLGWWLAVVGRGEGYGLKDQGGLGASAMGSSSLSDLSMQGCALITCRLASAACVCFLPDARRLPAACPPSPCCSNAPGLICWV